MALCPRRLPPCAEAILNAQAGIPPDAPTTADVAAALAEHGVSLADVGLGASANSMSRITQLLGGGAMRPEEETAANAETENDLHELL